jgi:hypothetical protein
MIYSIIIGIGSVVALMLGWAFVQAVWRSAFHDEIKDEDALAGRSSCGACGCGLVCERKQKSIKT